MNNKAIRLESMRDMLLSNNIVDLEINIVMR